MVLGRPDMALTFVLAAVIVAACSSGTAPGAAPGTVTPYPTEGASQTGNLATLAADLDGQLVPVQLVSRDGPLVVIEFSQGLRLSVDLRLAAVFDCRASCIEAVGSDLPPTGLGDTYCFWQHATGQKFWVNRPECPNGVRRGP